MLRVNFHSLKKWNEGQLFLSNKHSEMSKTWSCDKKSVPLLLVNSSLLQLFYHSKRSFPPLHLFITFPLFEFRECLWNSAWWVMDLPLTCLTSLLWQFVRYTLVSGTEDPAVRQRVCCCNVSPLVNDHAWKIQERTQYMSPVNTLYYIATNIMIVIIGLSLKLWQDLLQGLTWSTGMLSLL